MDRSTADNKSGLSFEDCSCMASEMVALELDGVANHGFFQYILKVLKECVEPSLN